MKKELSKPTVEEVSKKEFLNESEVSILTGIKPSTLQNHRHKGRGFPFLKYGKKVIYRRSDVIAHLDSCLIGNQKQTSNENG
jgi:hypothetical protein